MTARDWWIYGAGALGGLAVHAFIEREWFAVVVLAAAWLFCMHRGTRTPPGA
jgi:hypothetical protein